MYQWIHIIFREKGTRRDTFIVKLSMLEHPTKRQLLLRGSALKRPPPCQLWNLDLESLYNSSTVNDASGLLVATMLLAGRPDWVALDAVAGPMGNDFCGLLELVRNFQHSMQKPRTSMGCSVLAIRT